MNILSQYSGVNHVLFESNDLGKNIAAENAEKAYFALVKVSAVADCQIEFC